MMALFQNKWSLRVITLVVWAIAAASLTYWVLRLLPQPTAAALAPMLQSARAPAANPAAIARLLGAAPAQAVPQASLASRFTLSGVVAGVPGGGAALIAVDDQPAQPFRVGSTVDGQLVLQFVAARQAALGQTRDGPVLITLNMPELPD